MIRVTRSGLTEVDAAAVMRSVGADLQPCTSVDRALGDRAGDDVLGRLRAFGDLPVGGAVVTPGGDLGCDLLIHVVIRSSEEPVSETTLSKAFRNGLRQAAEWGVGVLVVPPLGTGAGHLEMEVSARVMCTLTKEHAFLAPHPAEVVVLAGSAYEEEVFSGEVVRAFGVSAR